MNTIWFDVTTSFKWRRPAVGIIRAEKEVGKYLIKSTCTKLEFCIYDNKSNLYYKINKSIAANLLADEFSDVSENIQDVKICEANFEKNDVYMTMGLDWDHKDYEQLYRIKKTKCFKVVTFCYDLIPVIFPHYCVGDVAAMFAKYFVSLAWVSDHVFCISLNTQKDFIKLLNDLGSRIPPSSVVSLGCDISDCDASDASPQLLSILRQKFILFVSTIDRRKNHEVIYRALTRIADRGGYIPKVVFVGMHGWGVENLMKDIELDPRTKEHITILNEINDSDLIALYKNAQFTVYPSLYEGWGLPVAESLAYGKYCLASNSSSIPEVGGDLIEYLDPYDVTGWSCRLEELSQNDEFLQEMEQLIRISYLPISWASTGAIVFDVAFKFHNMNRTSRNIAKL
jgi:glycosyltransferase involved in cell wall biosynthesis